MKTIWQNEEFCRDSFGAAAGDVREVLVARMARTRRRTRVANAARVACCAVAVILVGVTLTWMRNEPANVVVKAPAAQVMPAWKVRSTAFYEIVRSAPLNESMIVRTDEMNVAVVRSAPGYYELISEEQMFAILSGWSVALVKVNGVAELEILGP